MENIKAIFDSSYKRSLGNRSFNNDFIERFYSKFLRKSEEISALFKNTNMSAQKTMLHDSIHMMVEYYQSSELPIGMKRVAEVHGKEGRAIPLRMYEIWLDSLISTVEEFDPEFNDDIEQAWREVLAPGIAFMKGSYS
jgi:hemoglobin-like flavoprotein